MESHESFADRMMRQTLNRVLSSGLDIQQGEDTLQELQKALKAMATRMAECTADPEVCEECGRGRPPQARDIAHLTKALDECARLLKFAQGEADHRSVIVQDDASLLRKLSTEQLDIVMGWLGERE